ncbi:MAG TPA: sulfite exporter TauE/SafE family protein [Micromonosporaceae bacterium]
MLLLAILAGALVGLSLGALGGGGSILTVPILVYLLGQPPHAATTGSLIVVGITSLIGLVSHAHAGRVRFAAGLTFGALGIVGSLVGSRLSASVDPQVLLALFAGLMVVAGVAMLLRQRHAARPAPTGPVASGTGVRTPRPSGIAVLEGAPVMIATRRALAVCPVPCGRALRIAAAATAVGLLTGFFGVGGGFLVVPALVLALGFSMPVAVGTSLLVIAVNSATALGARLGQPVHLDWRVLGIFTAAAVIGGLLGGRVVSKVRPERLTTAFTVLLFAVAAYTAARSLPHLF